MLDDPIDNQPQRAEFLYGDRRVRNEGQAVSDMSMTCHVGHEEDLKV